MQDALTPVRLLRYNSFPIPWDLGGSDLSHPQQGRKIPPIDEAPRKVIARGWQRHVIQHEGKEEHINGKAYTLCVVERLQEALRRHEVFGSYK